MPRCHARRLKKSGAAVRRDVARVYSNVAIMDRQVGGVLHCFTESREVAEAALDLGMHISLSGIVSFKSAKPIKPIKRLWLAI